VVGKQLSFDDRTYLVTGGGSGIGKGVAAALVEAGANVMGLLRQ
jgi:NAD(P)-dependent dehydrogenase (short-subunit alcohol dehydrogenase family)